MHLTAGWTMPEILAPRCPGCDQPPALMLDHQYWCGNEDCQALTWDPTEDPAQFKAKAKVIDLGPLAE